MFCSKCGKELRDDAKFCDGCGAKILSSVEEEPKQTVKEGAVHKCPYCGEILSSDSIICPSCGNEIRGRKTTKAVLDFYKNYALETDVGKKIELVKTYPIPNNKEDIVEFMVFASSNFDVKYYVTNKSKDSLACAWLTKIEQCYQKSILLFKNKEDINAIEGIYNKVNRNIKSYQWLRLLLIIFGFACLAGTIIIAPFVDVNEEKIAILGILEIIFLVAGILLLVFGFKKKKTNQELEAEKKDKLAVQARKDKIAEQKRNKNIIIIDDDDDK